MGSFLNGAPMNIMASMNQWERDTISERTRDALHVKIVNHERAGQLPYGYSLADDGVTLLDNPREQAAIGLILSLHGRGYSLRAICRELMQSGYQPAGTQWHAKSVSRILKRVA